MNRAGINTEELSKEVGASLPTIHAWCRGDSTPNLDHALRVAQAMGVKIEDIWFLFQEEESPTRWVEAEDLELKEYVWPCSCENKYQDEEHGNGARLFREFSTKDGYYFCTNCGTRRFYLPSSPK